MYAKILVALILAMSSTSFGAPSLSTNQLISCLNKVTSMYGKTNPQQITVSENEIYLFVPNENNMPINKGVIKYTPMGVERCDLAWTQGVYFKTTFGGKELLYKTSDGTGADGVKGSAPGATLRPQTPGPATNCKTGAEDEDIKSTSDNRLRKQIAATAGRMAAQGSYMKQGKSVSLRSSMELENAIGEPCIKVDFITDAIRNNFVYTGGSSGGGAGNAEDN